MNRVMIGNVLSGLFALAMLGSGAANVSGQMEEAITHLGYPAYFAVIIGVWKLLGAVAVVVPGFPAVRNAAYAGFTFVLTGAAISHLAVGDAVGTAVPPLVMLALGLGGGYLRLQGDEAAS